jgi:hypothetical protein
MRGIPSDGRLACDVTHDDPVRLARIAAVRSAGELDHATRSRAREMTPAQRLREGFALSAFAARLAGAAR